MLCEGEGAIARLVGVAEGNGFSSNYCVEVQDPRLLVVRHVGRAVRRVASNATKVARVDGMSLPVGVDRDSRRTRERVGICILRETSQVTPAVETTVNGRDDLSSWNCEYRIVQNKRRIRSGSGLVV